MWNNIEIKCTLGSYISKVAKKITNLPKSPPWAPRFGFLPTKSNYQGDFISGGGLPENGHPHRAFFFRGENGSQNRLAGGRKACGDREKVLGPCLFWPAFSLMIDKSSTFWMWIDHPKPERLNMIFVPFFVGCQKNVNFLLTLVRPVNCNLSMYLRTCPRVDLPPNAVHWFTWRWFPWWVGGVSTPHPVPFFQWCQPLDQIFFQCLRRQRNFHLPSAMVGMAVWVLTSSLLHSPELAWSEWDTQDGTSRRRRKHLINSVPSQMEKMYLLPPPTGGCPPCSKPPKTQALQKINQKMPPP